MSFFNELKRRNVFKVALAYLVASWLVLQITDVLMSVLGLPEFAGKFVFLLLVIGFIPAMVFSWAYEVTPEGIKRESEVDRSRSVTQETAARLNRTTIILLIAVAGMVVVDRFVPEEEKGSEPFSQDSSAHVAGPEEQIRAPAPAKSIAVLPFVNMSEDAGNEYFSDGISEEILNALAKVDDLKIAGRTSSFAFKGRNEDLRAIGEALGVGHILEGSVRKAGNTVRITAQLVQVEDGFHLWSETFDRELINVFAIQDEIASAILEAMKAELLAGESDTLAATETDPRAYELYLLARQRIYERKRTSIESAVAMLDEALSIDPDYAPALAQRGIATLLLQSRNYGSLTAEQAEPIAKSYFDRAIATDPHTAEAWAGLGLYYTNRPRENQVGIENLEKALALNPNLIDAQNWLQQGYSSQGEIRKTLGILEGMLEQDPLYPPVLFNLALTYSRFGMFEHAERAIARVAPYLPDQSNTMNARALIQLEQGEFASAIPLLRQSLALDSDSGTTWFGLGLGLLSTHQFEAVLTEDMPPWQRIFALHATGSTEEATLLAYKRAAAGDIEPLLSLLNREGRPADVVRFFNDRWSSVAQFGEEYPSGSDGYPELLELAYAFSQTGDRERFQQAIFRIREDHDAVAEQGVVQNVFMWREAYYHALAGNENQALDFLDRSVAQGGIRFHHLAWSFPVFKPMVGDPRYEAIQQRMIEHLNRQRAELGLEPVEA
jgi:TolB-like protein